MPIDLSWSVTKEVVGWVASATRAARTRSQGRIANVVEHVGVLVAGVNRLNTLTVSLLRPLIYFDPSEWDPQSRASLIRDLILLSDEGTIVPRMRTARSALRPLLVAVDDIDVRRPAADILAMADFLFDYDPSLPYPYSDDHEASRSAGTLISRVAAQTYGPDSILAMALPDLVRTIRSAEQPDEVDRLHRMARALTAVPPERIPHLRRRSHLDLPSPADATAPTAGVLAPFASSMQVAFGELIGAQQRVFPQMPSPTWAFTDR